MALVVAFAQTGPTPAYGRDTPMSTSAQFTFAAEFVAFLAAAAGLAMALLRGEVVVRPTMTLTCAFDHRVADGAQAAQFVCELRDLIESPQTALLDL